eukprot:11155178-Lingulodinium_polyedra.AAC.1
MHRDALHCIALHCIVCVRMYARIACIVCAVRMYRSFSVQAVTRSSLSHLQDGSSLARAPWKESSAVLASLE